MLYDHKKYQLNSLRTGFITSNKLYTRESIFFNCASQSKEANRINRYNELYETGLYNLILLPLDLYGEEPGDDYDIYQYYENVLGVRFPICEKLSQDHIFFKDFSAPSENFTNYVFDKKLKFVMRTTDIEEAINV